MDLYSKKQHLLKSRQNLQFYLEVLCTRMLVYFPIFSWFCKHSIILRREVSINGKLTVIVQQLQDSTDYRWYIACAQVTSDQTACAHIWYSATRRQKHNVEQLRKGYKGNTSLFGRLTNLTVILFVPRDCPWNNTKLLINVPFSWPCLAHIWNYSD